MDKLGMHTQNLADSKYHKLKELFPNAVTETIDENGRVVRGIDADVLRQEISVQVVEGPQERYQFTWPDKRKSVVLANAPVAKTLRLDRAKCIGRNGTAGEIDSENIYIEGNNLDVLKLLQETYFGKIKMIYIDPPYNTGNDYIYRDHFIQDTVKYLAKSGQFDEEGNRLVQNTERNGRFHTDWLNMLYPRLRIARDLLKDDGVIFISIDDKELINLCKICDEIFGAENYVALFPWRKRSAKSDVPFGVSQDYEWILCYARTERFIAGTKGKERRYYETADFPGRPWRIHDLTKQTSASERPNSFFTIINPKTKEEYPANPNRTWAITKETFESYYKANRIVFPGDYPFLKITKPALRYWKEEDIAKAGEHYGRKAVSTRLPAGIGMSQDGTKEATSLFGRKVFPFPKPSLLIQFLIDISMGKEDILLDFFSGSASSAQAVMQKNAEDGGNRKFIMIQLEEKCKEKSEAKKAGYETICSIGEDRIRRAGQKIREETGAGIDYGCRVFRIDSTNMKDIYYRPADLEQQQLELISDNIKSDRTPEDLLFQVMLELGIPLSSGIQEREIDGKQVFSVADDYLLACFDSEVTENTVTEIAGRHPFYAVFRDSSMKNDSILINIEQIFDTYSSTTILKIL